MALALRGRRLGRKLRRQHIVAGYIVDSVSASLWLVVEVDGEMHRRHRADDRKREEHRAALGVRILRLQNAPVLERLDGVRIERKGHCKETAASLGMPSPAPAGEGTRAPHAKRWVGAPHAKRRVGAPHAKRQGGL